MESNDGFAGFLVDISSSHCDVHIWLTKHSGRCDENVETAENATYYNKTAIHNLFPKPSTVRNSCGECT